MGTALRSSCARRKSSKRCSVQPKVTPPLSIGSIDVLTNSNKFDEALACYRHVLKMCQVTVAKDSENIEAQSRLQLIISRIGRIGQIFIMTGRLANAIDTMDQAIDLAPSELRWQGLRALAFMMYGNVHRSKAIYLEHCDDEQWKADAIEDFKFARSKNFSHPFMDEIEQTFDTGSNVQA